MNNSDLYGIRWTENTELVLDDQHHRLIPEEEAEKHEREYGPTGITPNGPSWGKDIYHVLKDPARHYQDEEQRELFIEDCALSQARGGRL